MICGHMDAYRVTLHTRKIQKDQVFIVLGPHLHGLHHLLLFFCFRWFLRLRLFYAKEYHRGKATTMSTDCCGVRWCGAGLNLYGWGSRVWGAGSFWYSRYIPSRIGHSAYAVGLNVLLGLHVDAEDLSYCEWSEVEYILSPKPLNPKPLTQTPKP